MPPSPLFDPNIDEVLIMPPSIVISESSEEYQPFPMALALLPLVALIIPPLIIKFLGAPHISPPIAAPFHAYATSLPLVFESIIKEPVVTFSNCKAAGSCSFTRKEFSPSSQSVTFAVPFTSKQEVFWVLIFTFLKVKEILTLSSTIILSVVTFPSPMIV